MIEALREYESTLEWRRLKEFKDRYAFLRQRESVMTSLVYAAGEIGDTLYLTPDGNHILSLNRKRWENGKPAPEIKR